LIHTAAAAPPAFARCDWVGGSSGSRSTPPPHARRKIEFAEKVEQKAVTELQPGISAGEPRDRDATDDQDARLPYRLQELIEAVGAKRTVVIVKGEAKADALWALGIAATTNLGGAGKWQPEFREHLRGADILLLPDNDEPGWRHVNEIGIALTGIAARIRVVALPGLPPKGDVCDWLETGGTREQLDALVDGAVDWVKQTPDEGDEKAKATARENELLEALARMPPGIEFTRQRAKLARDFGVPRGAIDDELEARRSGNERATAPLHGHWIVEPWPEPVDGDSLLRDIIQRIRRHVVCTLHDALAIALWIMFAWVHDEVATHSPILNVNSAEPESGKTTTLGLVSFLAPRCVSSVEISEAALYRAIQLWQPSFAIDEFDSVLASEDKAPLRSVINSGHTRGQGVIRCVAPDFTPQLFTTFSPKAIGMIGRKLPATILGRCIMVELRRRKTSEPIERFEHKDDAGLAQLRSRLARWAADSEDALRDAKPRMPTAFDNRRADNWRVMLAIADLAGGDWGDKARDAASKLEGASDTSTLGVRLLTDIKRIFEEDRCDCILSAVLVERLKEDPEQPWATWGQHGKGLTQNGLATLLGGGGGRGRGRRGGFGIHSETVHPPGGPHGRGYKRTQFEDAWGRYLPPEIPSPSSEGGE
jgi:putative DNA primase/helicase